MPLTSVLYAVGHVIYSKTRVTLPVPTTKTSISDHIYIVTGANTGLGLESCRHLSRLGAGKVIMGVRSLEKGEGARREILEDTGREESSIEVWHVDMDDHESVTSFATRVSTLARVDGVLANAGIATFKFVPTNTPAGDIERSLNVNVINTFLLLLLLLPKMRESSLHTGNLCRFSIPNSTLHHVTALGELDPKKPGSIMQRLNDSKTADMAARYNMTKLLVIYAVREIAAMTKSTGKGGGGGGFILNTPNPSFCVSGLAQESADAPGFKTFERLLARSAEEGSRSLVHGLLSGEESHGRFIDNCKADQPARFVTNSWGHKVQKAFGKELMDTLEELQPGISRNI